MKYSVVIVDDQNLLSAALEEMINAFDNFKVLYRCKNKSELKEKLEVSDNNIPDIIVVDVNCPDLQCIQTIEWIVASHKDVKVMALFRKNEDEILLKVLKAGADGCLHKDTKKSIFEGALLTLSNEGFYNPRSINNSDKAEVTFKTNELKFMRLACSELTYKEIAEKMFLSPKTIDGYRDSLFTKLNVKNRVGMVMYALKHKIYVQ